MKSFCEELNNPLLFNKIPEKYQSRIAYINITKETHGNVYNIGLLDPWTGGDNKNDDIWADTWSECLWYIRHTKMAE